MLIHGGCDISFQTFFPDTWSFGLISLTWRKLNTTGNAPASCGHGAVLMTSNQKQFMYVYGGISSEGDATDALHALNLETMTWALVEKKKPYPPPRTLLQHSLVAVNSSTFAVVSGTTSEAYRKIDDESTWYFDVNEMKWHKASNGQDGNVNVGGSAATVLNQEIVVSGGYRSDADDAILNVTAKILNSHGDYTALPNQFSDDLDGRVPQLAFHAAIPHQGCLVLISGFNNTDVSSVVWVLNPNTKQWSILDTEGEIPIGHFASGVVSDGNRYVWMYGGRINPNGARERLVGDIWRLYLGNSLNCTRALQEE